MHLRFEIRAHSREPQDVDLAVPVSRWEATAVREHGGIESQLPYYKRHLLCDAEGGFPIDFGSSWEKDVLEAEMKRDGFRFWYQNPARPTQDSLGVAYRDGDITKIVRPDFLFFVEESEGGVVVDIVDPHSVNLADSLPKLQGMARYAAMHPNMFRRVEAVAEVKGKLRVLDLTRAEVREAIAAARSASALYEGALARNYPDLQPSGER